MSETWSEIHSDMAAEAAGERAECISEYCRCNCPTDDHTLESWADTWTEPGGVEFYCDGPCGGDCDSKAKRRRCGDCGAWCDEDDVVTLVPTEGELCPSCGACGEMEAAR